MSRSIALSLVRIQSKLDLDTCPASDIRATLRRRNRSAGVLRAQPLLSAGWQSANLRSMYRHAPAPAYGSSPETRKVATANVLLDELPAEARLVPWARIGASLVALACLMVLVWQQLTPATSARVDRVQTSDVTTYTIEQTAQLGEL